jgi:membrane protein implicated in regulation of membrane protease activity
MKARLIITIITNLLYEVAIVFGIIWLLPKMGIKVPWWVTLICVVVFALYAAVCFEIGNRTLRRKPVSGFTDMTGYQGVVTSPLKPDGYIKIEGEIWAAEVEKGLLEAGSKVEVIGQKGLKLVVRQTGV